MRSKRDLTRPGITSRHLMPAPPRTRTATSNLRTYEPPILASRGPRRPKIMIPEPRAVVFWLLPPGTPLKREKGGYIPTQLPEL